MCNTLCSAKWYTLQTQKLEANKSTCLRDEKRELVHEAILEQDTEAGL